MNDERPPVYAHVRFQQERSTFDGLNLRERFERIHETNFWGADTSVSGTGSEDATTRALREELPGLLKRLGVKTLLDAPCGDASWISTINLEIEYIGADIVAPLIESLQRKADEGAIQGRFIHADITCDSLPRADAVLCRDCLVHLSFKNIQKAVENFRDSGIQWLIATHFTDWDANQDIENGDWRALNLTRPPFSWPAPHDLLNERCGEVGGAYSDKCLGAWALRELPL